MSHYAYPRFDYVCSQEQMTGTIRRHPVVVIGAGAIGLTAALDLADRGQSVVVLDDNDRVSLGSRAVCYAKRPLEIWDRLGCAAAMVAKGISWKIGKVVFRDQLSYQFDLLPEADHKWPARSDRSIIRELIIRHRLFKVRSSQLQLIGMCVAIKHVTTILRHAPFIEPHYACSAT